MRNKLFLAVMTLFGFLTIPCAHAQTGLYLQYTGMHPSSGGSWMTGPTFGVYQDRHSLAVLHLGLDFRGSVLSNGNDSFVGGLAGLRGSAIPHVVPIKVYAEGLVGAGRVDFSQHQSTNLQYQVNGGLEYTLLPRLDWRVVELAWSGFAGSTNGFNSPFGLSSGIILRLP